MNAAKFLTLVMPRGINATSVTPPSIDSTPVVGTQLDYTPGVWSGATSVSAQAQRSLDGSTGWANVGASWDADGGTPYEPIAGDFGYYFRVVEEAEPGGATATSNVAGTTGAQVDFSALSDGALPSYFTGASWAVASGVARNTPVGTSKLLNGGFETPGAGGADVFANWGESIAGTSTVNRDTTQQRTGTACLRLDIDASNNVAAVTQNPSITVGQWLTTTAWFKASTTGKSALLTHNNQIAQSSGAINTTTSYAQTVLSSLYTTATGWNVVINRSSAASSSLYADDAVTMAYDANAVMTTANLRLADATVKADWTIVGASLAGVVMNVDNVANPQNYVALAVNNLGAGYLVKVVAGVPSTVAIITIASYVAGQTIELRKSGTTYRVFVEGLQRGTNYTISDAGIVNNTIHGMISTFASNTCNFFYVGGASGVVVNVPNAATLSTWTGRVSPGDTLRLAPAGAYTSVLSGLVNGVSGSPVTIDGNGATITGGATGVTFFGNSYINVRNLNLRNQTQQCMASQNSNNINIYDCTFKSVGTPTFIDVTKIRSSSQFWFYDCTVLESEGVGSCDGFEFWDCDNSGCVDCHAEGLKNGASLVGNGHGFEVYGENAGETCLNIQFIRCTADDCRAGFTAESPNANAPHTVFCTDCVSTDMEFFDFYCDAPATMTLVNSPGTQGGGGTFN